MDGWTRLLLGYVALLVAMSPLTFGVYAWDQWQARRGGWRVSEKALHTLELLGGWPGAWSAMRTLRHKSRKTAYRRVYGLILFIHASVIALLVWQAWK